MVTLGFMRPTPSEEARVADGEHLRRRLRWDPEIELVRREGRGHDADDGVLPPLQNDVQAGDVAATLVATLPKAVADDRSRRSAVDLFLGRERPTDDGLHAIHGEESRRGASRGEPLGDVATRFGDVLRVAARDCDERVVAAVPVLEASGREEASGLALGGVRLHDDDEAVGIGVGKRLEHRGVDDGEDGGRCRDPRAEDDDGRCGESGAADERSGGLIPGTNHWQWGSGSGGALFSDTAALKMVVLRVASGALCLDVNDATRRWG